MGATKQQECTALEHVKKIVFRNATSICLSYGGGKSSGACALQYRGDEGWHNTGIYFHADENQLAHIVLGIFTRLLESGLTLDSLFVNKMTLLLRNQYEEY